MNSASDSDRGIKWNRDRQREIKSEIQEERYTKQR